MPPRSHKFCVAPMMDWTDRHCRVFHRQLTQRALLYTEMVTAEAILHGDRDRLLDFDAAARPDLTIVINGGIGRIEDAREHLAHVDGVMLGRAAYQTPWLLANVDRELFDCHEAVPCRQAVLEAMADYADAHVAGGGRLNNVTRHMLGLFHGEAGGRLFRRYIAENAPKGDAAAGDVLREAGRIVTETAGAMRERRETVFATTE